jgi:hypothetical protein
MKYLHGRSDQYLLLFKQSDKQLSAEHWRVTRMATIDSSSTLHRGKVIEHQPHLLLSAFVGSHGVQMLQTPKSWSLR